MPCTASRSTRTHKPAAPSRTPTTIPHPRPLARLSCTTPSIWVRVSVPPLVWPRICSPTTAHNSRSADCGHPCTASRPQRTVPPPVWGRRPLPPHKGAGSNRPPTSVPVTNAPLMPSRNHRLRKSERRRPSTPRGGRAARPPVRGRARGGKNKNTPSRPSASCWLAGLRRGVGGRGCGPGSWSVCVCMSSEAEGSLARSSLLSTVSGTVGGIRTRSASPADRARVGRRADENYKSCRVPS